MANNIGLKITLGGVDQVIGSIKDLETAIGQAKQKLEGTGIGTTEFKNLSTEIQNADSKLKDLRKSSEGLEFNTKLGEWAKFGAAVTASFAAATAAVNLFGGDSEEVGKAAAKAQNLLTIALAARAVAESQVAIKTVATTTATIASTFATQGLTAGLRVLWATMAANPIGAVLTLLGLLVSALVLFTDSSEDAAEAEDNYQKQLAATNRLREQSIEILQAQGASEETIARKRKENADAAYIAAERAYIQQRDNGESTENVLKRIEELQEARHKKEIARLNLQTVLRNQAEDKRQKNEEARKKREEQEIARIQILIDLYTTQILKLAEYTGVISNLERAENQSIKTLTDRISKISGYESSLKELTSVEEEYLFIQNQFIDLQDKFGEVLDKAQDGAEGYFNELKAGTLNAQQAGLAFQQLFGELKEGLSPEQQQLLADYIKGYKEITTLFAEVTPPFDLDAWEQALIDLALFQGTISLDPFERDPEQIAEAKLRAQEEIDELKKQYVDAFTEANFQERLQEALSQPGVTKLTEEQIEGIRLKVQQEGEIIFKNLTDSGLAVVKFEQGIKTTADEIVSLNNELKGLSDTAKEGFLLSQKTQLTEQYEIDLSRIEINREKVLDLENEIRTKRFDQESRYADDITTLTQELLDKGLDITGLSYEARLVLLQEYLKKEQDEREKGLDEEEKLQQEKLNNFLGNIQEFQQALNTIAQATADFYQGQLDELDRQQQFLLNQIVGDTEQANQKRLELEESYQEKVSELEKKAAKRSLQIALAQSIANSAEAITKAYAQFGLAGFIPAAIIAAASVAQTAIIGNQLAQISQYQMGGLVTGPSHQQGGVRYQQGGIELEGGEAIINRVSAVRYSGLLSQLNQNGGGKPLVVNNSFDDSRLLEALAKQRSEPIRAYVLEQDISSKQGVQRRLEQLSSL